MIMEFSNEHRKNLSIALTGKKHSLERRKATSIRMMGNRNRSKNGFKKGNQLAKVNSGENHYRWNPNREAVRNNKRNDGEYKQWVEKVKRRDKGICQLKDENCKASDTFSMDAPNPARLLS